MAFEFKFWLYGSRPALARKSKKKVARRAAPTPKRLVRLHDDEFKYAKGFHLFVRKSARSKWLRVTPELELFPSVIRSGTDRELFIESYADAIRQTIERPVKPKKAEKKKPELKEVELELPSFPTEPEKSITKKEFNGHISRIIMDELFDEKVKWSDRRINAFIDKLWRNYSHAPHLLISEEFRRNLVSTEIQNKKQKDAQKIGKKLQKEYRKKLQRKKRSNTKDIGGKVKVQFKEVFNFQRMRKKNEMTMATLTEVDGLTQVAEVPRQKAYAQLVVDYDKNMEIPVKEAAKGLDGKSGILEKVRSDIKQVFKEAVDKSIFKAEKGENYIVRLIVPLLDEDGKIPDSHINLRGERVTGHGYGSSRHEIDDIDDMDDLVDDLFEDLAKDLYKYIKINNAVGVAVAGFVIERALS